MAKKHVENNKDSYVEKTGIDLLIKIAPTIRIPDDFKSVPVLYGPPTIKPGDIIEKKVPKVPEKSKKPKDNGKK